MAVFRVLKQKWSFSTGPGGCLSWCFGTGEKNLNPQRNDKDYGTTDGKTKPNGTSMPASNPQLWYIGRQCWKKSACSLWKSQLDLSGGSSIEWPTSFSASEGGGGGLILGAGPGSRSPPVRSTFQVGSGHASVLLSDCPSELLAWEVASKLLSWKLKKATVLGEYLWKIGRFRLKMCARRSGLGWCRLGNKSTWNGMALQDGILKSCLRNVLRLLCLCADRRKLHGFTQARPESGIIE